MSEVVFTTEQKSVINARNCNLLVSAAAGSGKTAVLVERIIRRLLDRESPVSLDRLLVMTFTRAAAEDMRQKISKALAKRAQETEEKMRVLPEDSEEFRQIYREWTALKEQETLLPRARIATIDSVCQTLIRQYFQFLEIDPAFRVADEAELKLMKYDVLKELLEEKYQEGAADFLRFSEAFTKNGLDEKLSDLILRTYQFASANPWPEEFLQKFDRDAAMEEAGQIWETGWMRALLVQVRDQAETALKEVTGTIELCEAPDGWKPYLEILGLLKETFAGLCEVLAGAGTEGVTGEGCRAMYAGAKKVLEEMQLPDLSRKGCKESTAAKKEAAKITVEQARKLARDLRATYFQFSAEMTETAAAGGAADIRVLLRLTLEFMDRFAEKKKAGSIVDFNDMEHLALKLLYRETEGGRTFTPLADELACGLDEILIDEYQDSNEVQEELIRALSAERFGRPDVFMVGDVKQSIYSFRQAKPALFMEKYRTYGAAGSKVKVELNRNFRSRPEVLDAVNDVFRGIMYPVCGGIRYDDAAALYLGRRDCLDPESGAPVYCDGARAEFLLVEDSNAAPEKTGAGKALSGEGTSELQDSFDDPEYVMIAERILELLEGKRTPSPINRADEQAPSPFRRKDIMILMRSSKKAEKLVDVLAEYGIDAVFDSATGYFRSSEVSTMLAFLSIIDNPRQDIALAAVMKSLLGGFTDGELADLRIRYGKKTDGTAKEFYDVLAAAAAAGEEKPAAFLGKLKEYRSVSGRIPVHELIHRIYVETGYYDYVSALPGGRKRRRNLDMLLQRAENYSATSYHGLFNFNRYIEQLQNYETDYGEAGSLSGTDDVVKITTIHKSKGLESPVTIVAGMDGRFNFSDSRERLVMDEDLGFACDYVDTEKRLRYPSLKAAMIRERFRVEQAGEELRILYVAMTRARDKLILSGRVKDYAKTLDAERKAYGEAASALNEQQLVFRSGAMEKGNIYPVRAENAPERRMPGSKEEREKAGDLRELLEKTPVPEEKLAALRRRLQAEYGHKEETALKPKVSVSELKARLITEFEAEFVRDLEENRATKGAEYGTIVHRAFELLDYSRDGEDALPELPGVDADTMKSVRRTVAVFRKTELAAEMKEAFLQGKLYREQHFMLGLPAAELTPGTASGELQLMQGIIDAYMITPGGIRLVDYKTDRVETEETLISRYALQLELYARALEQLLRVPVTEKLIYSTCLGKAVKL